MSSSTDKREEIQISEDEIIRQKQFIDEVKSTNFLIEAQTLKRKTYYIATFGCQMNENDSERLAGMLTEMGFTETVDSKQSDLIIFNTCCVRDNAELKFYGHLGALKNLKAENPDMIIAVCGCMMQQKDVVERIKNTYRQVDIVFGTHNLYKFPEMVYKSISKNKTIIDVWDSPGIIAENLPIERKDGVKAWVTIMYGCDNYCSYCIVPYVRGRERSRSPLNIINEVDSLGKEGYKEVTLLGQNVNSYGKDLEGEISFAKLLYELDKVEGIERIRFMTSHPKDLSQDLIIAMKECKKVCNHIHFPIQSGSTRILKEMNRKYTKEDYINLVQRIRFTIPDIALTTDIIVGFPGETEEDFLETLDVLEKVRFDFAYTFLYSKRTGTPAAKSENQISEEVKKERFDRLVRLQNNIVKEENDKLLGRTVKVLVEGVSKSSVETYTGRTESNKLIHFSGSQEMVGKIIDVKIQEVKTWSLEGEVL